MFVCPVPSTTCTVFVSSTAIQRSSCNPLATADGFGAGVSARIVLKAGLWSETCFLVGKRERKKGIHLMKMRTLLPVLVAALLQPACVMVGGYRSGGGGGWFFRPGGLVVLVVVAVIFLFSRRRR
jgi:hypothetical protein